MSGQWEVVGKKKERKTGVVNDSKEPNKKKIENVKLEDILAKTQVKELYKKGKETKMGEKPKNTSPVAKKAQKKPEKTEEKVKPPKTIEAGLKIIDIVDLKGVYERSKSQFPDAPLVWLKSLSQFLNQKIPIETDPVFTSKSLKYPYNIVPAEVLNVIKRGAEEARNANLQAFFDMTLSDLTTDLSKNLPVFGHRLLLQYIALNYADLVVSNLPKHISLRVSYQNRPNIGLSLLWAVGQAGLDDFKIGFRIFKQFMLPLIELKHYSKYVLQYLVDLLKKSSLKGIEKEDFILILDVAFSSKKNLPIDVKKDLIEVIPPLKTSLLAERKQFKEIVESLLKELRLATSNIHQNHLCDVIIEALSRADQDIWGQIYREHVKGSSILLKYINNNWKNFGSKLNNKKIRHTLTAIEGINNELVDKRKKEEGLETVVDQIKILQKKMETKKARKSSCGFWFFISLLVGLFVIYDISHHGGWNDSVTKQSLDKAGNYTNTACGHVKEVLLKADESIKERYPEHYQTVATVVTPYYELFRDLRKIVCRVFESLKENLVKKYPIIDNYAPELLEQSKNVVNQAWTFSLVHLNKSVDYLKSEVFTGQLAPDNVQKVISDAFSTTQHKASECYDWLYQKIREFY